VRQWFVLEGKNTRVQMDDNVTRARTRGHEKVKGIANAVF
jgi:hypothetical protein